MPPFKSPSLCLGFYHNCDYGFGFLYPPNFLRCTCITLITHTHTLSEVKKAQEGLEHPTLYFLPSFAEPAGPKKSPCLSHFNFLTPCSHPCGLKYLPESTTASQEYILGFFICGPGLAMEQPSPIIQANLHTVWVP